MNWLRTIVFAIGLAVRACGAETGAPRLTLRCGEENDLFRVLVASGYKCQRVDSNREAVGRAAKGGAVLILTIHKEENIFNAALDLGVKGDVLKDDAAQDLLKALRAVAGGQMFLSPSISSFLLNRARRLEKLHNEEPGLSRLTPMEVRVLTLVAKNQTNKEIGQQLFISARTVHTHRNNICTKLNLHGARGLLLFALEHREDLRNLRLLPERMG